MEKRKKWEILCKNGEHIHIPYKPALEKENRKTFFKGCLQIIGNYGKESTCKINLQKSVIITYVNNGWIGHKNFKI